MHENFPTDYEESEAVLKPLALPDSRVDKPAISDALLTFQKMSDDEQEAFVDKLLAWQRERVVLPVLW